MSGELARRRVKVVSTCFQYSEVCEKLIDSIEFTHVRPNLQGFLSKDLAAICAGAQIAVIGDDQADEGFFTASSELKLLIRWGAGTDNVDFEAAAKANVQVLHTPGLFGEDVADMALSMAISLVRNIPPNSQKILEGEWPKETTLSFRSVAVGIMGSGAVGRELQRLIETFGPVPKVYDPFLSGTTEPTNLVMSLDQLVTGTNVLFVCAPLTEETLGVVNPNLVSKMTYPRFVVNVSRGELLEEAGILHLLLQDEIQGLGLDVFENEPPLNLDPALSRRNIVVSSHNGSNTHRSISLANAKVDELITMYVNRYGQVEI